MKSIIFNKYGDSEILKIGEKNKPNPKKGEVLLSIKSSSVNDWDWGLLRGQPFINRLLFGLIKPKVKSLGIDVSGIVESTGEGVKDLEIGTEVYGDISAENWGGYAEYVCVKEKALKIKPRNISHEESASIPHSGVLAIQSYLDYKEIKTGDEILINGAGGGAGTLAIQLGKYYKARITGVDKKIKFEMMEKLGVDELIDYQKTDFTKLNRTYDLIIDFAGSHGLLDYKKSLKKGGLYLLVGGQSNLIIKTLLFGQILSKFTDKEFKVLMHEPNKHLDKLTKLIEEEVIKPIVGKVYKLEEVSQGLDYFGSGECTGKVIIKVE